jgi:hypothetical protein
MLTVPESGPLDPIQEHTHQHLLVVNRVWESAETNISGLSIGSRDPTVPMLIFPGSESGQGEHKRKHFLVLNRIKGPD